MQGATQSVCRPSTSNLRLSRRALLIGFGPGISLVLAACGQPPPASPLAPTANLVPAPTPMTLAPTTAPTSVQTTTPSPRPTTAPAPTFSPGPALPYQGGKTTPADRTRADAWFATAFSSAANGGLGADFPISFTYGDQESAALTKTWRKSWTSAPTPTTSRHTLTVTDPRTELECRCEITTYPDSPAVEWVAYFRNNGPTDSPILANILPLDVVFPAAAGQLCRVYQPNGARALADDFAPYAVEINLHSALRFVATDGRPSSQNLPFFNLDLGDRGVVGAIGWTGRWKEFFARRATGVQAQAGMAETSIKLHPGEEIRTPRIALIFWEGDYLHGQNLLRQFLLAHHTPRIAGQPAQPPIFDSRWGGLRGSDQISQARWLKQNQLDVEAIWIDASWYGDHPYEADDNGSTNTWATQVGNWYPRKALFPDGLKPVGDAVHQLGLGFLLWVEPERVYAGTQLAREHPEWLLGVNQTSYLLNLGIPAARAYITDQMSALIDAAGLTVWRTDFNIDPNFLWTGGDAPDRAGMTEIRYVEGLYQFWDDLLARHPGLLIDNCASGGRRLDLEALSRSVPLWRTDYETEPHLSLTAIQSQTHSLSMWLPTSLASTGPSDTYSFRSGLGAGLILGWSNQPSASFPFAWARAQLAEYRLVRPYFYGDFYPLVPYSQDEETWDAWQFDRPDLGEGTIVAFRRPASAMGQLRLPLRGLDPGVLYEIQSMDGTASARLAGQELLEPGLNVAIADQPGSALFIYRNVGSA